MKTSHYAQERASNDPLHHSSIEVTELDIEDVEMTYPGGLSREEYDALESPQFSEDESDELDSFAYSTNTYNNGFDPFELDSDSCHRAFCNNFSD